MMLPVKIGVDLNNHKEPVRLNPEWLSRHLHIVGATGAGKTVSIHALLRPLLMEPRKKCCLFVIDPMGNLSFDLLRWIASKNCPEHVRRRLVYIEPANEDVVTPFNPLTFTSEANFYYQVARAVDLVLRAWAAQDLGEQPRLMQWSYKAMCACAAMGFPLSMSRYLLHPGTQEHKAILERIPDEIRHHWEQILTAKGGEPTRILESVRNRFDPFYNSSILRRMFGSRTSRFDVEQFIRERRIVILNLAKLRRVPTKLGSTIGSLAVNEIFETAYNMSTLYGAQSVEPTYVLMDEFQRFVSPDIEDALPTVRQMGLRLILAHQSFAQLERGEIDLSNMIWQARNRWMFANSGEDADIIAEEIAKLTFDRMAVKDRRTTIRQLIRDYRIEWLESESVTNTHADSVIDQRSVGYNRGDSQSRGSDRSVRSTGESSGRNEGHVTGGTRADSEAVSRGRSQHLVPIHETFEEESNVTYLSFDEHRLDWMRTIRELKTGICFGKFVDHDHLYKIHVDHKPIRITQRLEARLKELLQRNYEQEFFISREEADRLAEQDRIELLQPPRIELHTPADQPVPSSSDAHPFRKRKPKSESS